MPAPSDYDYNGGFVPTQVCDGEFVPDGDELGPDDLLEARPGRRYYYLSTGYPYYALWRRDPYYALLRRDPYYGRMRRTDPYYGRHTAGGADYDYGKFSRTAATPSRRAPGEGDGPLDVVHVGPYLARGGAEQWLIDLAQAADPEVMRISRHIAVSGDGADPTYINDLTACGIVVEVGGIDSIQEAADEADVILSWGIELDEYLGDRQRPLSVQIVHGDAPWNRYFLDHSRRSIDHAVAVSHRVNRRICGDIPSTVIYNGVHGHRLEVTSSRARTRAAMGFAEKDFVVGYFGRLSGEKRVHTIIQAVSMLPANVKLLIVGRGCLETELRELAAQSLPGRHAFTFTDGAMGDLYAASDAVCLASNQEGFSLVMLEAMLSGCAFVSTPVGAAGEVLCDGETGLLFDGSEAGLTHALRQLVDRPLWRRGLAEAGRRRAERFGYASRMARDYEHLLSTLHQRSRSA